MVRRHAVHVRFGGNERVIKFISFPVADHEGLERAEDCVRFVRTLGEAGCRICLPEPSPSGLLFETVEHDAPGGLPRGRAAARVDAFWEGYRRRRDPGGFWIDRLDLFL